MENLYEQLEFKQSMVLVNPYGIKIFKGSENKEDWAVLIPKKLAEIKFPFSQLNNDYCYYLVTEQHALSIAKDWTEFAKNNSFRRF